VVVQAKEKKRKELIWGFLAVGVQMALLTA
jgi:hypothetical protein